MKKLIVSCCLFLLYASGRVGAQDYPATFDVSVTYYDFHSNGSNPDFNHLPTGKPVGLGMVKQHLGANGLPVDSLIIRSNWGLNKWFTPWVPGDYQRPQYVNEAMGTVTTVNYDTSYINQEIPGQLTFNYHPEPRGRCVPVPGAR